jgi:hypothetical protein
MSPRAYAPEYASLGIPSSVAAVVIPSFIILRQVDVFSNKKEEEERGGGGKLVSVVVTVVITCQVSLQERSNVPRRMHIVQ